MSVAVDVFFMKGEAANTLKKEVYLKCLIILDVKYQEQCFAAWQFLQSVFYQSRPRTVFRHCLVAYFCNILIAPSVVRSSFSSFGD